MTDVICYSTIIRHIRVQEARGRKRRQHQSGCSQSSYYNRTGNCLRMEFLCFLNPVRFLLVLLLMFSIFVAAEDIDDMPGRLEMMKRCRSRHVYVNRMYLTCDSPSAYYNYETDKSSYQGSTRCKYGDKGRLYVFFSINDDYGWVGVDISIDVGVMNSYVSVQSATDVCSLGILNVESDDDGSGDVQCPSQGDYQLYWTFSIPEIGGDEQLQYYPDIRVKFFNQPDDNDDDGSTAVFPLGCAGFGTAATVQEKTNHRIRGEWALGISLALFFSIFGLCLLMTYRRKKQVEQELKGRELHRYYYYARNSATGELVPVGTNREEQAKHHHESYHEKTRKQILRAITGSMDSDELLDPPLHTPWR
mmetsp:Transcript_41634/g.47310  ORF Transcript_41634/g.47310 Transcript_41634/m.47310 type:complete len:362 (+) Transcript_41634:236-1321(+)